LHASVLGRALPEKKSVRYSMTLADGVSANRLNIIEDGKVLIQPRRCSAACSGDMAVSAAAAAVAVAAIAVSCLCVCECESLAFIY